MTERLLPGVALPPGHRLVTIAEAPELWRPTTAMTSSLWPEFMLHDATVDQLWGRLALDFPGFQTVLLDREGAIAGAIQSAPLAWDGTDEGLPDGWDAQLQATFAGLDAGRPPTVLGALLIAVVPARRAEGLSATMLDEMRAAARAAGLRAVIACVRPTAKDRYPLMSIDDYARWQRPDGLPVDPWLRVHVRAGGRIVRGSPRSMELAGSVAEWGEWTGLDFPVSGAYVVPGALAPVEADLEAGRVVYHDPNVWVIHDFAT